MRRDRQTRLERRGPALERRREHLQPGDGRCRRASISRPPPSRQKEGGIGDSQAFTSFFFSPRGYLRSFTMFLGEFVKEMFQARRTRRSGVQPQMHRGLKYAGHAGGEQRRAARHERLADHRRDVPGRQRHLHGLHRLRRDRPSLRAGARRVASTHSTASMRRSRRWPRRRRTPRVRTSSSSCRTTGRAWARRSSNATGRAWARRRARLMGGRATLVQTDDPGRGFDVRERIPVGGHVAATAWARRSHERRSRADDGRRGRPRRRGGCRRPTRRPSQWSAPATWGWCTSPATTTG